MLAIDLDVLVQPDRIRRRVAAMEGAVFGTRSRQWSPQVYFRPAAIAFDAGGDQLDLHWT